MPVAPPIDFASRPTETGGIPGSGKETPFSLLTRITPGGSARKARRAAPAVSDERLGTRTRLREWRKTTAATVEIVRLPAILTGAGGQG